jgi:hypothetical protein
LRGVGRDEHPCVGEADLEFDRFDGDVSAVMVLYTVGGLLLLLGG